MVAEALQLEEHEAGKVIYRQGDLGDCFYLIHEGTVAVRKSAQAVDRLGPKAFFGEQALLKAEKRYAVNFEICTLNQVSSVTWTASTHCPEHAS